MTSLVPPDLSGLWVPIVTPFDEAGEIDQDALATLAGRLLADGGAGLVALGTTGEPATLTPGERRRVVETCGEACRDAGRGLIVGAGTNSTRGTIDEIERLTTGVDATAVLIVVPYYTRPSEAAIVEHFAAVAEASPLPVVAYNVPYRTGRGLGSSALLELAGHERIIGLKQAVGGLDVDTLEVLAASPDGFQVLAGDDAFIAPTMLLGGVGAIAAAAHLCTPLFAELVEVAGAGDVVRTAELAHTLLPVVTAGFAEPNPAVWKGALHRAGELPAPELRRPMTPASNSAVDALLAAAHEAA